MRLAMSERRVLVKAFAARYQAGCKKQRSRVLDEFVAVSGYDRAYASWLLRWHGRKVRVGPRLVVVGDATKRVRRRRPRVYDEAVVVALVRLWVLLDYLSGKRLAPALKVVIEALERHGELTLKPEVRAKLLTISPATIDRVLAPEKKRYALKSRAKTKPGTLLRHQVPIRTFAEWDDARPGFVEVDLAGHDGGWDRGDYAQTLTLTDVATTWTELGTARNKAQVWVFGALQQAQARFPFPLLGIHSDNGGEFINNSLIRYCREHRITFTRSRPYRKNDNCFVEQKNWSVVRRFVGYGRLDTGQACAVLTQLDAALSDYLNFFVPSLKLVEKVREGARVHKRYDRARTPLERVLASPDIAKEHKQALRERAFQLNPAALMRTIRRLQRALDRLTTPALEVPPPSRAVDADGLRKAGTHPTTPTFPQPLEIAHTAISTPPTAPTTTTETTHAFT
jgi:hypothetical protein